MRSRAEAERNLISHEMFRLAAGKDALFHNNQTSLSDLIMFLRLTMRLLLLWNKR